MEIKRAGSQPSVQGRLAHDERSRAISCNSIKSR
jgi:hypothetical protein